MAAMKKMTVYPLILLIAAGLLTAGYFYFGGQPKNTVTQVGGPKFIPSEPGTQQEENQPDRNTTTTTALPPLPPSFTMSVPFTIQAPFQNWVVPFKEACEEASVLMAGEYFAGNTVADLDPDYAKNKILELVDWEQDEFGYHLDIDSSETSRVLEGVYGLRTEILKSFDEESFKRILFEGKVIILPSNGKKLGNPNFRPPGPPYHMLVLKGYDETGFITNDPGTRKGKDYKYTFDILLEANGDWSHNLNAVDEEDKTAIVVWK